MNIDMRSDHYELVSSILSKYLAYPDKVFDFGSRVTGDTKDFSDFDKEMKRLHTVLKDSFAKSRILDEKITQILDKLGENDE